MSKVSERKLAANRENAQKSTGPAGTLSTRFNAQKHGLLSQGVTELDNPETFEALVAQLKAELQPVGILEEECVQQIALLTIRIRRARLLEAEAFTAHLNPPKTIHHPATAFADPSELIGWNETVDAGLPAQASNDAIDGINRTVLRYRDCDREQTFPLAKPTRTASATASRREYTCSCDCRIECQRRRRGFVWKFV